MWKTWHDIDYEKDTVYSMRSETRMSSCLTSVGITRTRQLDSCFSAVCTWMTTETLQVWILELHINFSKKANSQIQNLNSKHQFYIFGAITAYILGLNTKWSPALAFFEKAGKEAFIAIQPDKDGEGLVEGILSRRVDVRFDLPPRLSSKPFLGSSSRFQSHVCCRSFQWLSLFLTMLSLALSTYRWDNLRTYLKWLL